MKVSQTFQQSSLTITNDGIAKVSIPLDFGGDRQYIIQVQEHDDSIDVLITYGVGATNEATECVESILKVVEPPQLKHKTRRKITMPSPGELKMPEDHVGQNLLTGEEPAPNTKEQT